MSEILATSYRLKEAVARQRLETLGLSLPAAAGLARIEEAYLGDLLGRTRRATWRTAERLAQVLKVSALEALWEPADDEGPVSAAAETRPTPEPQPVPAPAKKEPGPWRETEDQYLLQQWGKQPRKAIAAHLNRTVGACDQRYYVVRETAERATPVLRPAPEPSGLPAPAPPSLAPPVVGAPAVIEGTKRPPEDPVERELLAMLQVNRVLAALTATERRHVVLWMADRYGSPP